MIRCLQCLSPSLRNQRDVSRPHSDCPQTRIQSGDPILRHDLPQELVQGWVCVCVWTSAVSRCGVRSSAALCWLKSFSECLSHGLFFVFQVITPTDPSTPSSQERSVRLQERPVCLETRRWTSSRPGCRYMQHISTWSAPLQPVKTSVIINNWGSVCLIQTLYFPCHVL